MFGSLKAKPRQIEKLEEFIIGEAYDTDSIKMDVSDRFDGNINQTEFESEICNQILQFIQHISRCMLMYICL